MTIDSNCNTYIKGNWNIQVDGTKTEVVTGAVTQTYKDTKTETVTKAVTETYSDTLTQEVTGDVKETFSATYDQDVTGAVTIDGSTINLNNGSNAAARVGDTVTEIEPAGADDTIGSGSSTVLIG